MKKYYSLIIFISTTFFTHAQLTWSDDVATIFYKNCTFCHNPAGIAPFSLVNYQEAYNYRLSVSPAVANGVMPPWTADTTYQRYSHERILTTTEKSKILNWVAQGAPEGNASNTPPPPVYNNEGFITQTPDLELSLPAYTSKATAVNDDYVCFSIPTGLLVDKKIKAFEVIPGNSSIVHHALVYVDKSGTYPTDTTSSLCAGPTDANTTDLLGGYVPGALPTVFPGQGNINFGYTLQAGANIVLAMHYPEGSAGMKDSVTKVRLFFYDDATTIREVKTAPVLSNWNFTIPANTISPVSDTYNLPLNVSLLSVFPHMHLLGNSIESYAVSPTNDTIPLVRINHWDFDWQEFLFFKYMKKIPANSTLYGKATYDNTTNNHHNPNNPPQDVSAGLNTTDEMFLIYFHFTFYQPGDENLNIDSLTYEFYSVQIDEHQNSSIKVYPNPFVDYTTIEIMSNKKSTTSVYIYNINGELVTKLLDKKPIEVGQTTLKWNGKDSKGTKVSPGIYFYSILKDGEHYSGKIINAN